MESDDTRAGLQSRDQFYKTANNVVGGIGLIFGGLIVMGFGVLILIVLACLI